MATMAGKRGATRATAAKAAGAARTQAVAKTVAAKKRASKPVAAKTTATKRAAVQKMAVKKAAAKKAVAKKAVAKKAVAKKATPKAPSRSAQAGNHLDASARIDRMIASLADWRGERLAQLRALIHDVDPGITEDWKWMGTPVWSRAGMLVLANAHKDKVKLTFFHGAKLADPDGLFNAGLGGGKWRAIDFRAGDPLDGPALKCLLRAAIAYNTAHAVPKSRGSRA